MFLCRLVDGFMHLVADGCGIEIHRTTRVLSVFKDMHNCCLIPIVRISRYFLCVRSADIFIISRWNKDLLLLQLFCNLRRTTPCKTQGIDFSSRSVNQPFFFIISLVHIPKRNSRGYTLSIIGFGLPYCTDFL